MTRTSRLAALAAAALALAACKTVGPNFRAPAASADPGYLMQGDAASPLVALTPDNRAAGPWWRAFGSAELDQVMSQALAGNPTIAQANASLERLRQLAIVQHAAQLPQVDASASAEGERINLAEFGFTAFPNPTLGLYSLGGEVSYDFDLFGGLRRATEAANARAESQARQADAAYLTLTGQVATAAFHIATVRASLVAAEAAIADDEQVIDMVHAAEAAGGAAPSAANKIKAQLAHDEAALPPLRQELAQARHALSALAGETPAAWTAPDFDLSAFAPPPQIPVSLPSSLVRRRPDILAAEADLHAATAEIGVADAALYPDLRLTANITQTALSPTALFSYNTTGWTLAGGLAQPLFHGGALKARRRAAIADANASLARYKGVVIGAFTQVADVMEALAQDDAEIAALTRAEDTAQRSLNDDETAFKLGGGALLPVIDDERQLQLARQALAMAQGQRLAHVAQLYVATAADWRDAAGEVNKASP